MKHIETTCSDCGIKVTLNLRTATATAVVPGNGLRGQKHVPGGVRTTEVWLEDAGLFVWDCPSCEYADSYEVDA